MFFQQQLRVQQTDLRRERKSIRGDGLDRHGNGRPHRWSAADRCRCTLPGRELARLRQKSRILRARRAALRAAGFSLDDLIAAFEAESHQDVAPFVRLWMKHPGVPGEFRARYEDSTPSAVNL